MDRLASREERVGHSGRRRMLHGVGYPTSIVLRCRVTPPFAELRKMLLVDEIDPYGGGRAWGHPG